jgi:heme/copper-type cytochrome/quinol oxidase subunit 2
MRHVIAAACIAALSAFIAIPPASATQTVTIKAKNFAFSPGVVTLKEGQPTALTFVATQGVHGITAPDIGLDHTVTITNSPTTVTVTPHKVGTFTSHCAIFCGIGHAKMQIVFKVVR